MTQAAGKPEIVLKGIAASPGVAHGPAFLFLKKELEIARYIVPPEKREEQIARFEGALMETRRQISAIRSEIEEKLGDEEAQIFDAHQLVLEDRALIDETEREIHENGYNIEYAFHKVANRYIEAFSNIDDDYIKERVSDIKDVTRRLLHNLMGKADIDLRSYTGEKILVSDELSPSDTARLERGRVMAIMTDQGSRTSHAVIMARSINVPAVVGLHDASQHIQPDDMVIVDGYDGLVIINPSETSLFRYGKIRLERQNAQRLFRSSLFMPAVTTDGHEVKVMLNVDGNESDEVLNGSGASGVGLFRTEMLFMRGDTLPSEDEQYLSYRRVVERMAPNPVTTARSTWRDKDNRAEQVLVPARPTPSGAFPASALPVHCLFKDQLRAILRASAHARSRSLSHDLLGAELVSANALSRVQSGAAQGIPFTSHPGRQHYRDTRRRHHRRVPPSTASSSPSHERPTSLLAGTPRQRPIRTSAYSQPPGRDAHAPSDFDAGKPPAFPSASAVNGGDPGLRACSSHGRHDSAPAPAHCPNQFQLIIRNVSYERAKPCRQVLAMDMARDAPPSLVSTTERVGRSWQRPGYPDWGLGTPVQFTRIITGSFWKPEVAHPLTEMLRNRPTEH
jgi:phosphotransferase system enzyme I (PtsI)